MAVIVIISLITFTIVASLYEEDWHNRNIEEKEKRDKCCKECCQRNEDDGR